MEMTDIELIRRYRAGEKVAFESLIERYLNPLYNFIFQLVRDKEMAEDIVQEAFIKAWKNLFRFDENKSFRTWLYAIAKNTAFDALKKKRTLPFSTFDTEEGNSLTDVLTDEALLSDELFEREENRVLLETKLAFLPPLYRAILLLRYHDDFTLTEIASLLNEPYNSVKSRHRRALLALRKAFGEKIAPKTQTLS